jgi:phosphoenolpyruvate phosphomutase
MTRLYESADIDAICIEDKQYPKRNSFRDGNVIEEPERFARKLAVAKHAQRTDDFVVIARLESLIVGESVAEAIGRARLYRSAGADALVIHSRREDDLEIAEFCRGWREVDRQTPVIAIPTTYYTSSAARLQSLGINAAIYANQLIRASIRAMQDVLGRIHADGSAAAAEGSIAPVSTLFELTRTDDLLEDEPARTHSLTCRPDETGHRNATLHGTGNTRRLPKFAQPVMGQDITRETGLTIEEIPA